MNLCEAQPTSRQPFHLEPLPKPSYVAAIMRRRHGAERATPLVKEGVEECFGPARCLRPVAHNVPYLVVQIVCRLECSH